MIYRRIVSELTEWADSAQHKPLIIRGARQVGKTTAVNQFAAQFDTYLTFNLELPEERKAFSDFPNLQTLLQRLFFLKNQEYQSDKKTLLFIDEIQENPEAIQSLRFFYEQAPELYVIAAGSLLETLFDQDINFPVGRVTYKLLRPVSFEEFLQALGETAALQQWQAVPLQAFAQEKLFSLFHTYALIGGMPEIVQRYVDKRDFQSLQPIYESLLTSYIDDIEKYAQSSAQVQALRHVIQTIWAEAGNRITFHGFGKSNYGSREMGEALRTVEKALLIQLIYPHTTTQLPLLPALRKSPRLQVLDTGLLNYFVGIQQEIIRTKGLSTVYQGKMIEHLVGQELLVNQTNPLSKLSFWVREKNTSSAEVDFLYPFEGKLIPIEVKSDRVGKLRSLHQFMKEAPHNMAVRLYGGPVQIDYIQQQDVPPYYLLNLPYFLAAQLPGYLSWFQEQIS